MPLLPTFNADKTSFSIGGGRRAASEDFGSAPILGHATQKAAASFLENKEEDEARKALVSSSEIRAKYARELDDAALSGADVGALKEKMQNDLNRVGDNFQTEKGAQNLRMYTANSEVMFDEQANKINVQRAYSAAKLEGQSFLRNASAIIQSNPAYLGEAEKNSDEFAATLKGIRPEQRNEIADGLKKQLNMAAAIGAARADPEGTKKKLEAGEWDLTPEQRDHGINRADTEMRAKRADENHQRVLKEYDETKRDETARDKQFKGIMDGTVGRRSIMDDADLKPTTREHLIMFMEHRTKELQGQEKQSDQIVKKDLWLRIHTSDSDPRKIFNGDAIFEAVNAGKLNTTDANQLNTLVANQKDDNNRTIGARMGSTVAIVGRALSQDPQFTAQPALVASIQLDYASRVDDKIAEFRAAKKSPNELFNPASKDYVGSKEFIQESITAAREQQRASQPQVSVVRSREEYDALEPGTPYVDSQGARGVKKGAKKLPATPGSADVVIPAAGT